MNSLNGFSLTIMGDGHLVDSDYCALRHNSEYKIKLNNTRNVKCDAEVFIDGESVGTWRINSYDSTTIERPSGVSRKFTFLEESSREASQAGIFTGKRNNGLVKVVFKPEKKYRVHNYSLGNRSMRTDFKEESDTDSFSMNGSRGMNESFSMNNSLSDNYSMGLCAQQNYSSGGTGLGNHSHQNFTTVSPIYNIDSANITTISTRLIVDNDDSCNCHGPDYVSIKGSSSSNIRTREPPRIDHGLLWSN